ncbi:MAG: EamA family transporter [Clostridia bacterium]|nr:EamA family transporter [Clostridia bacterium]
MFSYVWPIALVVLSNTVYQVCAKEIPAKVSPFASLTVTYLIGAAFTAILHFVTHPSDNFFKQLPQLNWASYVLGLVIVGLEVGLIYAYKAGWQVSTASIVQSAFLAVALIFVGALLYKEGISWNKLTGIALCLMGLVFINYK